MIYSIVNRIEELEADNGRLRQALERLRKTLRSNWERRPGDGSAFCRYCGENLSAQGAAQGFVLTHKADCPVAIAQSIKL